MKGQIHNCANKKNQMLFLVKHLSASFVSLYICSCLQHHMTGALTNRFTMQIRMSVLMHHMFPLPVHKPAWWAGPFSLTFLTNIVSIGSSRPFWYSTWQKTKQSKHRKKEIKCTGLNLLNCKNAQLLSKLLFRKYALDCFLTFWVLVFMTVLENNNT